MEKIDSVEVKIFDKSDKLVSVLTESVKCQNHLKNLLSAVRKIQESTNDILTTFVLEERKSLEEDIQDDDFNEDEELYKSKKQKIS